MAVEPDIETLKERLCDAIDLIDKIESMLIDCYNNKSDYEVCGKVSHDLIEDFHKKWVKRP